MRNRYLYLVSWILSVTFVPNSGDISLGAQPEMTWKLIFVSFHVHVAFLKPISQGFYFCAT